MTDKPIIILCKANELDSGAARQIEVAAVPDPLALFNVDGELYLTDDTCTHGMAPLSLGFVENGLVYCPLHGGAFELATGRATVLPCTVAIKSYRVWREGEDVVTDLSPRPTAAT
jgi:nitrite reductase/ring-hydroxylating ferredoxin subunit